MPRLEPTGKLSALFRAVQVIGSRDRALDAAIDSDEAMLAWVAEVRVALDGLEMELKGPTTLRQDGPT